MVMTVFLTGCDPVGLRRICVPVSQRPNDSATIEMCKRFCGFLTRSWSPLDSR